jgi:hypothetical protein
MNQLSVKNHCTDTPNLCAIERKTTMIQLNKPKNNAMEIITTYHADQRFQQRAISEWAISQIVQYGSCIHKQKMRFCYMTKKEIGRYYNPEQGSELKDLIVLMSADSAVITAYRNPDAVHTIKCKGKRLAKESKYKLRNKHLAESNRFRQTLAA